MPKLLRFNVGLEQRFPLFAAWQTYWRFGCIRIDVVFCAPSVSASLLRDSNSLQKVSCKRRGDLGDFQFDFTGAGRADELRQFVPHRSGSRWRFYGGTVRIGLDVAVGLAASAKYPGGVLLLGLFYAIFASRDRGVGKMDYLWLPLLTGATFLFVTPGAFVDPRGFLRDIHFEIVHYGSAGHGGYTVSSRAQHLRLMILYLGSVAFSPVPASAVLVFGLSFVGAVVLIREDMRVAPLLIALPVIYVLYVSSQRVMIARNLLFVMPFLAVLAGRGAAAAASLGRPAKHAVFAVLAILIAANYVTLYKFSTTVESRSTIDKTADVVAYLRANLSTPVYLSPAVRSALGKTDLPEVSNLRPRIEDGARVVYSTNEVWAAYRSGATMRAVNRPGLYTRVSGPVEVNWDYYPNCSGDVRIMAVSADVARMIGVPDGEAKP